MKLTTQIIALCEYASLSRENKLSINGIFDEIRVSQFPGGVPRAFLVATLSGSPDKSYNLTIKLEHDNKIINASDITTVTSGNGRNNLLIEFVNLGFESEGDYKFVINDGKVEVGSTEIKVIHVQQKKNQNIKLAN